MPRPLAALLVLLIVLATLPSAGQADAAPPTGFTSEVVPGLNNVESPTAFAFLPDGSLLVALKAGRLLRFQQNPQRLDTVFDRVSTICSNSERGLLGVAVDPQFATNRFVYVYYTFNRANDPACPTKTANEPVNRLSRLTLSPTFTTADETVLLDNIGSPNGNHNAGDVQFGKDGYLYVSIGDGGANAETARQLHNLSGTIVRITRDGGIPADNPFQGANTARCNNGPVSSGTRCQEIFAFGFRNPFRLGFDPNATGTRFFVNDVGAGAVEEISEARSGGDFGWHCFEGSRPNQSGGSCQNITLDNTVRPTFEYRREGMFAGCASITGGAFVPGGAWPSRYDGAYLFADYVCGKMFALIRGQNGFTAEVFDPAVGAATHMTFGPDGSLYYAQYAADAIYRVRFTGNANRSPVAQLTASPDFGNPPLQVNFDASASSDPDSGDTIAAYLWEFGDGSAPRETSTPTTSYTYTTNGRFEAKVRVRDNRGAVSTLPATVRIDVGNAPPVARIDAPANRSSFSVGEQITLRGSATDPEDGAVPAASLSWEVRRHHDTHYHPYLSATGAQATLTAPTPEDLAAVNTSWLEVILTATDSRGLASTPVTIEIRPRIVSLRFETEPPGLRVSLNDGVATTSLTTPTTVQSWPGWALSLSAPAGQSAGGVPQQLCGWRHGGSPSQSYVTPLAATTTVRAIFTPAGQPCPAQVGAARVVLPVVRR